VVSVRFMCSMLVLSVSVSGCCLGDYIGRMGVLMLLS
jgi:hypothetical protein